MESIEFNERKIEYSLIRKNVKNINLRIKRDGLVVVSASPIVPKGIIDSFVSDNAEKILSAIDRIEYPRNLPTPSKTVVQSSCLVNHIGLFLKKSSINSCFIGEDDITFYLKRCR